MSAASGPAGRGWFRTWWRRPPAAETPVAAKRRLNGSDPAPGMSHAGRTPWFALADEGYRRNVIAHRCITLVAGSVARVPWRAYDPAGREDEGHPALALVDRPRPGCDGIALREAVAASLLIGGEAFVQAVGPGAGARPTELHLLRPDRVRVVPGAGGVPAGYEVTADGGVTVVPVDPVDGGSDLMHLRLYHPLDDWRGLAPMEAAAGAIDQHNAAAAWNRALLANAARPSGALVHRPADPGAVLSDEQFERLKAEVEAQFAGASAAGRPMLLDGGLDWQPFGLTPSDMDWLRGRDVSAREIALAFGVPAQLVGVPDAQTWSNMAEARLALWEDTVLPLAERIAAGFAAFLEPWFGPLRLVPDPDEVPALEPRRAERWRKLADAPFLTDAERRAALGYGPRAPDAGGVAAP